MGTAGTGLAQNLSNAGSGAPRYLFRVSADSATDAWAIGKRTHGGPLVMHWDGDGWAPVAVPTPGYDLVISGVEAVSPTDVWIVGEHGIGGNTRTLIEHWDGSKFTVVPSPNPNRYLSSLATVSAASADDVWASGHRGERCLVEHWDGRAWGVARSPGGYDCDVSAIGTDDAFATDFRKLLHWDGQSWTTVARTPDYEGLRAVEALADDEVWVVGDYSSPDGFGMRWNGKHWADLVDSCSYSGLDDLAVNSATDAWAVGSCPDEGFESYFWHWDGVNWTQAHKSKYGRLYGIGGSSPDDVWAVGEKGDQPLIEHWDGSTWSTQPLG